MTDISSRQKDRPQPADEDGTAFLSLDAPGPHGAALGLRPGDLLTAVNGIAVGPSEAHLRARFGKAGTKTRALTFHRGTGCFNVLASRPDLGRWVPLAPEPDVLRQIEREQSGRLYPDHMCNWEVYRNADGFYDLQPLRNSLLALLAAPVWLAQMRLWAPMAVMLAVVLVAIPTGWIMTTLMHVLASIYIWRAGPALFRADRIASGFRPQAIVAAAHERGAHQAYTAFDPKARFVYSVRPARTDEDAVPEATPG
ncbi:hypothetical protein DKT77_10190 [Meridianimarinicoccus roseus]|uniref:PDZ domain-containing protein n=1 Tax=Meridianimarinicoccus roseus TaxID=2072018 RepID=A0A2V2LHD2_9RHOB|nr:hypothetical protein [Meridianimarinicoccus roseus]PWR02557.1 hypothetical protein DKT77_10190 [Meridianimarinicoccus roseus]